ncbi:putative protein-serine/threonine phosphatase [Helianthus annuus]|nr:putative protein-serine/threonine phosphatase [Helianthus annuus]
MYLNCEYSMGTCQVALYEEFIMMYATADARSDGMFLLCGGRDTSGVPLADAYGLLMHKNGQWEWTLAPGVSPSSRYQHAAISKAFISFEFELTENKLAMYNELSSSL